MKYQDKTFSVPYMSKEYSNNWEKTFKSEKTVRPGDLVAVKEERYYWFGIVEEINPTPPHTDDIKFCIKVSFFDISSRYMSYSWESEENTYLIKRNVMEELK